MKVCFRGTAEEIRELRKGLEDATGTSITLEDNCISDYEPTGAKGYETLQEILGQLVNSRLTYTLMYGDPNAHFTSYYDAKTRAAGILKTEIGKRWYWGEGFLACTLLIGRRYAYYNLPGLIAHELLGHGSGQNAVQVENLVHSARGELRRCPSGE